MSAAPHALVFAARLLRPYWLIVLAGMIVGSLAGLASAVLISMINKAIHIPGNELASLAFTFLALTVAVVLGEIAGSIANSFVGQRIVAGMRQDLADKILTAPIARLERIQPHRLIASLDRDLSTISAFTFMISSTAVAFAILIGCFCYLIFLSPLLSLIALAATFFDALVQYVAGRRANKNFDRARGGYDDLQKQYSTIISGAKELRVSRERRLHTRDLHLAKTISSIRDQFTRAMSTYFLAKGFNSAGFFLTTLLMLAVGQIFSINASIVSAFVFVLLFVRGSIDQIISSMPLFSDASVSLRRIAELWEELGADGELLLTNAAAKSPAGALIELRDATFSFSGQPGDGAFRLGPINLEIKPGEMVFICGANGSGKTTLIKLLLALYSPTQGELLCDGKAVTPATRDAYRQLFSVVFFDYFLFEDLMDPADADDAARHFARLEINHLVHIADSRFSTTGLSTGQRKRLALTHVLLEDRPIIVLDEWAADQDPAFRAVFYLEILPELKRSGKTLVVASHDDRYFSVADRILRLDEGRLSEL